MTSTLGFAILAVLARGDRTGYDIAAAMRRPVGFFWTAGHSQIHAELQKLLAGGLVGYETRHGPGPQDKKLYHLTDEGSAELRVWVTQPPKARPGRRKAVDARHHFSRLPSAKRDDRDYSHLEVQS